MNERDELEQFLASPKWKNLSVQQKTAIYFRSVFGMWLDGLPVQITPIEIFFGAWFSFTKQIEKISRALEGMTNEERSLFIAGLLIGLLCLLLLASKLR